MRWETVKLEDLTENCFMVDGDWIESKDQDPSGGIRLLQLADIGDGYFIDKSNRFINQETSKKLKCTFLKKNDILIARMPDPIGRACIFPFEEENKYITVVDVCIMRVKSGVDPKYVTYAINSTGFRNKLESQISGTTRQRISGKNLKNLEIPLPPLATQKRIAEILDAADVMRRKDQELLKKYDKLAQAIFIDMFGDPVRNEKGWEVKKLDAVCSKITDGEHGTVIRLANGKPYLMARNIRDGFIDFTETDFISEADHNRIFKRCNPEKGDLLLVCVGATIGRVCLMNSNDEFSLARSVALIKPKKNLINSKFLFSIFKSNFIQLQIKAANNSSAQAGLYTGKIKDLNIFIPPIELQNEFEIRINVLLEQSQCIDISKSDALFKSLIQKAFKGELVS